ncbi:MAG: hypothetical protein ABI793_04095, partial [Flavobacterium sp.]
WYCSYVGEYVVAFLFKNPVSNETGFFVVNGFLESYLYGSRTNLGIKPVGSRTKLGEEMSK